MHARRTENGLAALQLQAELHVSGMSPLNQLLYLISKVVDQHARMTPNAAKQGSAGEQMAPPLTALPGCSQRRPNHDPLVAGSYTLTALSSPAWNTLISNH